MVNAITDHALTLAAVPHEYRPKCVPSCRMIRVYDTKTGPTWRCENCLRYYTGQPERARQESLFDGQ